VLAATAPLLQRWFASSGHESARDPYFLYAASNAGSLLALIAYPIVIEPRVSLGSQTRAWAAAYIAAAVLILLALSLVHARAPVSAAVSEPVPARPSRNRRIEWLGLAFAPSSLLLAVTTYLSTDLASVPLLWIVPLLIYLLAFIVAFSRGVRAARGIAQRLFPLVLLPLLTLMIARGGAPLWFAVPLHLVTFAATSLLCIARLADTRPHAAHLTEFYLWMAAGGMLAGAFNSILAPAVFNDITEYPLVVAAACFLLAGAGGFGRLLIPRRMLLRPALLVLLTMTVLVASRALELEAPEIMVLLGAPALLCFSMSRDATRFAWGVAGMLAAAAVVGTGAWGRVLHADRTFYGVYRVSEDREARFVTLYHGTTVHGRQQAGDGSPEPLTYYYPGSPIADVLRGFDRAGRSIGVVGLGVGSLAAYARPGDRWTFYELDPAVERIARDARFFQFLQGCPACAIEIGDARVSLTASRAVHDLLVMDAFSSDAVPVHLLTKEAIAIYGARLAVDGVLAFHVSNRHVELRPVLARLARDLRWSAAARFDPAEGGAQRGYSASDWVVLGRDSGALAKLLASSGWNSLTADDAPAWTDDFSNLWNALRWR
jgi:hypothetical protein